MTTTGKARESFKNSCVKHASATVAALLLAAPASPSAAGAPTPRPNLIFLLTDDQRDNTFGAMGHPLVKTPNLDRLMRQSVRFRNAYIASKIPCLIYDPRIPDDLRGRQLDHLLSSLDCARTILDYAGNEEGKESAMRWERFAGVKEPAYRNGIHEKPE